MNEYGHGPAQSLTGDSPTTDPAAPEGVANATEAPKVPVSGPGDTRDGSSGRVCGYRGCRAALPVVSGRGNRAQYCQDGKTWGSKELTCKQAAQAVENVRSLPDGDEPVLDDTSLSQLGAHIDRVLAPVQDLASRLTAVRAEVDGAVADALQARDAAEQRARDAEGKAEVADQRASTAEETARQAEETAEATARLRAQAESDRDAAIAGRDAATAAKDRAEARLADAADGAERADRRAAEAGDRAATAESRLAALTAERDTLAAQLAQDQATVEELHTRLETQRDQHSQSRDQIREKAQAEISHVREAAKGDVTAARHELAQAASDYASQLGELRQQLGSMQQQVSSLDQRAAEAEHAHSRAASELHHWHRELAAALAAPGADGRQLAACVEQLLAEKSTG